MPRITNEEIAELRNFHAFEYETDNDSCHILFSNKTVSALDRLAELEAAVTFKSFDEVPEDDREIELLHTDGKIEKFYYHCDSSNFHNIGIKKLHEITGWRYPVGDLS